MQTGTDVSTATYAKQQTDSRWMLCPLIDYLFVCGGLVWILFGIHYFMLAGTLNGSEATTMLTVNALGVLLLTDTHIAATFVHVRNRADLRHRPTCDLRWLPLVSLMLVGCSLCSPRVAEILVKLYLLLLPHHFMSQSYGIARVYCLRHRFLLSDEERNCLLLVTWCTTAFAVINQLSVLEPAGRLFLGQKVPSWIILPESLNLVSLVLLVACSVTFLSKMIMRAFRKREFFPLPALLVMVTGIGGFIMFPPATGIYWLYLGAFFHASQYLLTVLVAHWNEQKIDSRQERQRTLLHNTPTTRMVASVLVLSLGLFSGLPALLEYFGFDRMLCVAAIFTSMNFYHFMLDGVIWKLRRTEVRSAVIG